MIEKKITSILTALLTERARVDSEFRHGIIPDYEYQIARRSVLTSATNRLVELFNTGVEVK